MFVTQPYSGNVISPKVGFFFCSKTFCFLPCSFFFVDVDEFASGVGEAAELDALLDRMLDIQVAFLFFFLFYRPFFCIVRKLIYDDDSFALVGQRRFV